MKQFVAAAAICACVPMMAHAQVLPGLGADRVTGSAGIETVAPYEANGLPANPANIGASSRWSLSLGTATNSVTEEVERTVAASIRRRGAGLAVRVTSKAIENLFDDPALRDDPDLRVGSEEYALGASVRVREWLRVGLTGVLVHSQVLGSSGSGAGLRAGVGIWRNWITAGATYGDVDVDMTWRAADGSRERWSGTKRVAVGVATPQFQLGGFQPTAALEWSSDVGPNRGRWLRATASLGFLNGAVRLVAGAAACPSQPTANYQEIGVVAAVNWLQFQLGVRFGADPVPGNALALGLALRGT